MKTRKALAIALVLSFCLIGQASSRQIGDAPLSKQEIISLLRQVGQRQLSQGEIVSKVEERGIAFAVDEKVIAELRQAGARSFLIDALERAAKNGGRPLDDAGDAGRSAARPEDPQQMSAEALEKMPVIEQARRHALEYAGELPNFIVTQTVKRFFQTPDSKDWKLDDTLEIELTYIEGKGEQFKLLRINGKPAKQSYESMGGSTSSGEFGSMLAAVFLPYSKAEFKEIKKDTLNNRATVVYDFKVKKANSTSTLTDKESGQKTIAGYSGSLWIDAETKMVLRIETANEGMAPGFPITLSESAVEYDWVVIGGERYLLPVRAEVLLGRDRDRSYTRNVIDFKNYQKFEAKIKVPDN